MITQVIILLRDFKTLNPLVTRYKTKTLKGHEKRDWSIISAIHLSTIIIFYIICSWKLMNEGERLSVSFKNWTIVIIIRNRFQMFDRYGLSVDEIEHGLPLIDTSKTHIREICPAFLSNVHCQPGKYRRYDGLCNNLKHPTWGAVQSTFTRWA